MGVRWTALHYASQAGFLKVMRLLLEARAEAQPRNMACSSPLALATMENQVLGAELLLKWRADPEARVKGLDSPLMMVRRDPVPWSLGLGSQY